jgi:putative transposase
MLITVHEKAIAFPTDARLYHKMRVTLVREAHKRDIPLRQSFKKVGKKAFIMQGRYATNKVWVTDFTYIRTHEGWLYLTVVIDLFSRPVVGWSMKSSPRADLVIDALLMAIWRRKPKHRVIVHSDQGVQYTCGDWRKFLQDNHLEASMSRRGNCHDNAVAESFFSLLKMDRIKRRIFKTRADARAEIFDYIEFFYNPKRHHGNNGGVSPMKYEKQYFENLEVV